MGSFYTWYWISVISSSWYKGGERKCVVTCSCLSFLPPDIDCFLMTQGKGWAITSIPHGKRTRRARDGVMIGHHFDWPPFWSVSWFYNTPQSFLSNLEFFRRAIHQLLLQSRIIHKICFLFIHLIEAPFQRCFLLLGCEKYVTRPIIMIYSLRIQNLFPVPI